MSDAITTETVETPVAEVVETPTVETTEEAPVVETVAGDADGKKKNSMLEELIEHRTVRRDLEKRIGQLEPVLSRMTPELQAAITEGRVTVTPARRVADDQRATQLAATAQKLNLFTKDAAGNVVPDIEAAARVDGYVREVAQATLTPVQHQLALRQARENIEKAVAHATANGIDPEFIRAHYENALKAPNGAMLVADPGVAEELWYGGVGRATAAGKVTSNRTLGEKKPETKVETVIPTETTGRRGATGGITLTPKVQAIYREHGLDPAKAQAQPIVRDSRGGIALE